MMIRKVKSLDEDFKAIGLSPESASDMGMGLIAEDADDAGEEEDTEESEEESEEVVDEGKKKCEGDDCPKSDDDDDEEEDEEKDEGGEEVEEAVGKWKGDGDDAKRIGSRATVFVKKYSPGSDMLDAYIVYAKFEGRNFRLKGQKTTMKKAKVEADKWLKIFDDESGSILMTDWVRSKPDVKLEDAEDVEDLEIDTLDECDDLDSPEVNMEMLNAISELPISEMSAEECDEVLEALKEKVLPDGDDELAARSEEVVDVLVQEAVAKKTRRAKSGSMAKKASFQCPEGTRKDPKDPAGRRCIKAAKAAGGAGKLAKQNRKKSRWSKSGSGKKSEKKSGRWAARREGVEEMSPFAMELAGLLEGNDVAVENVVTIRGEIVERLGSIMEMLHEEFMDENVTDVMEGVYESIADAMDMGNLDEGIVGEDEFIAEMKPALQLIAKSLGQIDQNEGSELGNE